MKEIVTIKVENVVTENHPVGPATYALAKHLETGGSVPPIHVMPQGGTYRLLDGRHRLLAHKLLGITEIKAKVSTSANYPFGHITYE